MADGVFLTLVNRPEIAQFLTAPFDSRILINIGLAEERQPDAGDQRVTVGLSTASEPLPVIDVLLGPDWLERLVDSLNRPGFHAHLVMCERPSGRCGLDYSTRLLPLQVDAVCDGA